jgi:precorrin-2 dehydrogenase/sirohydrochlorin ferrochelatase
MDTQPTDSSPPDTGPTVAGPANPAGAPRPLPLVMCLEGAPCLVVGAGPVAARRVRTLLDAGAVVTVIAPEISDEARALVDHGPTDWALTLDVRTYVSPEAAGYRLVVPATGDGEVDDRVTSDALAGGALVNRAGTAARPRGVGVSGAVAGTVVLPAVHRAGAVTVAISTDGSSPALARWLRDRIAVVVGPEMATLATMVDEGRRAALATGGSVRAVDWPVVFDELVPLITDGRIDAARSLLAERIVAAGQAPLPRGPQHR